MFSFALPLLLLGFAGCVGQVAITPEDEVTPGEALGFDFINYVERPEGAFLQQEILEIEADGRTVLRRRTFDGVSSVEPVRFLSDTDLFDLRTGFNESDFFVHAADSPFDVGEDGKEQSIVYQIRDDDGTLISAEIRRQKGEAPVPEEIAVLFDRLALLVGAGIFETGDEVVVAPVFAGSTSRIDRRTFVVVKSADTLLDLLFRIGSIELSVLPSVDYEREMLACVFLGADAGETVEVAFDSLAYDDGDAIKIRYRRRDAAAGCAASARPFALARLPRTSKQLVFFEANEREVEACRVNPGR